MAGNKVKKGFMFYLFLLLGALVGAFIICVVIMIFVPGYKIFGLSYYNENTEIQATKMAVYDTLDGNPVMAGDEATVVDIKSSDYKIKKIVVNSPIQNVFLFETNGTYGITHEQFIVKSSVKTTGFSKTDNVEVKTSLRYYLDTQTLQIDVTSPEGFWVTSNNSWLEVQVPENYDDEPFEIEVNSSRGDIILGGQNTATDGVTPTMLVIKGAKLKTNGSITATEFARIGRINYGDIGDCRLETTSIISITNTIYCNSMVMKTGAGDVKIATSEKNVLESGLSINSVGDVVIESDNTHIVMQNIKAKTLKLKNSYATFTTKEVIGNVVISAESNKCDYTFDKISGSLTAGETERYLDGGSIVINDTVTGTTTLVMNAKLKLKNLSAETFILSDSSEIEISQINAYARINNKKGNVIIGKIEDADGNISCGITTKVDVITENAKVEAYFDTLPLDGSAITTKGGQIDVTLKPGAYTINAKTDKKLVCFEEEIKEKKGTWTFGENPGILNLKSENGKIEIKR